MGFFLALQVCGTIYQLHLSSEFSPALHPFRNIGILMQASVEHKAMNHGIFKPFDITSRGQSFEYRWLMRTKITDRIEHHQRTWPLGCIPNCLSVDVSVIDLYEMKWKSALKLTFILSCLLPPGVFTKCDSLSYVLLPNPQYLGVFA